MTDHNDLFPNPDAGLTPDQAATLNFYRQTVELRARIQLIQMVVDQLGYQREVSRAFGKLKDADYKEVMDAIIRRDEMQIEHDKPRIITPGQA